MSAGRPVLKFNVKLAPEHYEYLGAQADQIGVSMADVIRDALDLHRWAAHEVGQGHTLLVQRGEAITVVVLPNLERLRPDSGFEVEVVGSARAMSGPGRWRRPRT